MPASGVDQIVFLQQQLAAAISILRAYEQTESNRSAKYRNLCEERKKDFEVRTAKVEERFNRLTSQVLVNATRYALLRSHQVQIWKLGIAATGEQLDKALDEQIKRAQEKTT